MGNPVDKHFRKFKRYVERTWIQEKLEFLSVYESPHHTNNSVESYNARWNKRVGVKHPNFWELVTAICEAFDDVGNEMGRLDLGIIIS